MPDTERLKLTGGDDSAVGIGKDPDCRPPQVIAEKIRQKFGIPLQTSGETVETPPIPSQPSDD